MRADIRGYDKNTEHYKFVMPEECPMCHRNISPQYIAGYQEGDNTISIMYYCTGCKHTFISRYKTDDFKKSDGYVALHLICSEPVNPQNVIFGGEITTLSERFTRVYNQAYQAEQLHLDEIAGVGYRKALEILIKDYAISLHPDDTEDIKTVWLKKCINKYITDESIKTLAEASADLGNDETHYERLYEDCSIEDLKEFINAAVSQIETNIKTKKAIDLLNSHKNSRKN